MAVACPPPQWPAALLEEGPEGDSSILLRGEATIGGTRFAVTAVRVNPVHYGPDYRADQNTRIYTGYNLSGLLDSLSDLVEIAEASTLALGTGRYLLWMLPHSPED